MHDQAYLRWVLAEATRSVEQDKVPSEMPRSA